MVHLTRQSSQVRGNNTGQHRVRHVRQVSRDLEMKISINIILTAVIVGLLSASITLSYNSPVFARVWDWALTGTDPQLGSIFTRVDEPEFNSTGKPRFIDNAKGLLADNLSKLGDAFTGPRDSIAPAPDDLPKVSNADNQPAELVISVEADQGTFLPDTDSSNQPDTKTPELVGAL